MRAIKKFTSTTMIIILAVLLTKVCIAIPPIASEYYGWVIVDGAYAPAGTEIVVKDREGIVCGKTVLVEQGKYGLLSCLGDDPSTSIDEGAIEGEGLIFYVDGVKLSTENSVYWSAGSFREVNMIVGSVNRALPLLEEPKVISEAIYFVFLSILLLIAAFVLAVVTRKIWKGIKRLSREVEALKFDELQ